MKKGIAVTMFAMMAWTALAAIKNNVYTGNAGDNDFNNNANWWSPLASTNLAFFRGDNIATNPAWANVNLSAPVTISGINYQGSVLASAAYNIGGANTLTLDGNPEARSTLIDVFDAVTTNQTISADLVLSTVNNANNQHIRTRTGAGLVLSGTISQNSSSHGVGIWVGDGDVLVSGAVNDSAGKLWKIHNNNGTGVLRITGTWVHGTMQIDSGVDVVLDRAASDNSALGSLFLQLVGGNLVLENDEQIGNAVELKFAASTAGTLRLNGNTETLKGLAFTGTTQAGSLDMGDGGVLRLNNQNDAATWGTLVVTNWDEGIDHVYVDGGSFSAAQLAAITFENWEPTGAKVEGGELLPTGSFVGKTPFQTWAAGYGVGAEGEDPDGDGLVNVYEYGLGGDPTNAANTGIAPTYAEAGGILTYVYPQLSDPDSGLDYHLELRDDLVVGSWTNMGYAVTGTNVVAGDFDYVTNEVSTASKSQQFIKLIIDTL